MQVIAAEGEQKSSKALKEASDIISESPAALQLRWERDMLASQLNVLSIIGIVVFCQRQLGLFCEAEFSQLPTHHSYRAHNDAIVVQ